MAKKVKPSPKEQVDKHIEALEPVLGKTVQAIRKCILGCSHDISEHIKWNNPAFFYTGEMDETDSNIYKRDMIVFNLFKGRIMLVFPGGAIINDKTGLLEGDYKDGRRTVVFADMKDFKSKQEKLQSVIKEWISIW